MSLIRSSGKTSGQGGRDGQDDNTRELHGRQLLAKWKWLLVDRKANCIRHVLRTFLDGERAN